MTGLKIKGDTSGSTTITAPNTGTDETIELSTALASKLDLAGGKILQIVRATDGTERSTTATGPVDVTGMSVTITPTKSTSAVIVIASFYGRSTGGTTDGRIRYDIADSSDNVLSGAELVRIGDLLSGATVTQSNFQVQLIGYVTPATTSAVTYKLRFSVQSAGTTNTIENDSQTGQMYAIEVSA